MDEIPHNKKAKTLDFINRATISKKEVEKKCEDGINQFDSLKNFELNNHQSSNIENKTINDENKLELSHIRPYGKWYETYLISIDKIPHIWWNGIFAVTKEQIQKHPKELYVTLKNQLNKHSNPEIGHYMERTWAALFC
jgi:hypothetical protein